MLKRVITSIVGLVVFLPLLIFSHTYAGALLAQLFGFFTVFEICNAAKFLKKFTLSIPLFLVGIGVPLIIFFKSTRENFFCYFLVVFFLLALWMLAVAVFSKGKIKLEDCAIVFVMYFYAIFSFNAVYLLRFEEKGEFIFFLPFAVAWFTDIFSLFSGKLFGRHKLIPDVSPKKTVEGAIGGFLTAVLLTVLYGFLVSLFSNVKANYPALIIAAVLMSLFSIVGDLVASLVKRHYQIKDFGWLLPGHGGVLDRFDSVLASAAILIILYDLPLSFRLFT